MLICLFGGCWAGCFACSRTLRWPTPTVAGAGVEPFRGFWQYMTSREAPGHLTPYLCGDQDARPNEKHDRGKQQHRYPLHLSLCYGDDSENEPDEWE